MNLEEEIWKPIEGFGNRYEVSSHGRIKRLGWWAVWRNKPIFRKEKLMKLTDDGEGYLVITFSVNKLRSQHKVHQLVAKSFLSSHNISIIERPQINHKDYDRSNNHYTNLEWVTQAENIEHATIGNRLYAINNPNKANKLTYEKVENIRSDRELGLSYKSIGDKYSICPQTAWEISKNLIWKIQLVNKF